MLDPRPMMAEIDARKVFEGGIDMMQKSFDAVRSAVPGSTRRPRVNAMDPRDLTKSVLRPAVDAVDVRRAAGRQSRAPPSSENMSGAANAFDSVSEAAEQQLDGWMKQTYKVGTGVQNAVVDILMLRFPDLDSSTIMRMAAQMQSGPVFQAIVKYGMPPVGWTSSLLGAAPRRAGRAAGVRQQALHHLARHAGPRRARARPHVDEPLTALVDRVAAMETFPRLWATEGLGNYYGDRALERERRVDPAALLTDAATAALPPWSLTMLHAGHRHVVRERRAGEARADQRADGGARRRSRASPCCAATRRAPGYAGAAIESLGLATRTLYPNLIAMIDREIPAVDPSIHGYFWHGAGRAMYFDPMNMLPSVNAPWRAIRRLHEEAPHDARLQERAVGPGLGDHRRQHAPSAGDGDVPPPSRRCRERANDALHQRRHLVADDALRHDARRREDRAVRALPAGGRGGRGSVAHADHRAVRTGAPRHLRRN